MFCGQRRDLPTWRRWNLPLHASLCVRTNVDMVVGKWLPRVAHEAMAAGHFDHVVEVLSLDDDAIAMEAEAGTACTTTARVPVSIACLLRYGLDAAKAQQTALMKDSAFTVLRSTKAYGDAAADVCLLLGTARQVRNVGADLSSELGQLHQIFMCALQADNEMDNDAAKAWRH